MKCEYCNTSLDWLTEKMQKAHIKQHEDHYLRKAEKRQKSYDIRKQMGY